MGTLTNRPRRFRFAPAPALTLLLLAGAGCHAAAGAAAAPGTPPERSAAALRPPAAPERWREVIGIYTAGRDTLLVLEQDLRLHLRLGGVLFPLTEAAPDSFRFPGWGRYAGESVTFTRDVSARAVRVAVAGGAFLASAVGGEGAEPFRINPQRPVAELRRQALAASPPREEGARRAPDLVELSTLDPTLRFDIRYATTHNFMGAVFYPEARAFLQRPAAEALLRAHRQLREHGYGLLIHDAYRPWHVTRMFWDATPPALRDFVADPSRGSRHNRGAAVDLTLYDLRTGQAVEMPSGYDEFSPRAHPDYVGGSSLQRWQRELLREVMEREGFRVYDLEWWHFDYRDWQLYPILNLTFEEIPSRRR